MKKYLFTLLAILFTFCLSAQTTTVYKQVSFIATPNDSAAAILFKVNSCPTSSKYYMFEDSTVDIYDEIVSSAWTYNAFSCSDGFVRSLQTFPQLATLPSSITIDSAKLILTGKKLPFISNTYGNSYHPSSPYNSYGSNEVEVLRVLQNWSVNTVTWNNQPAFTNTNKGLIQTSTSRDQYDAVVDVTGMLQDMIDSSQRYGFLFKLQVESYYRDMVFYSSNTSAQEASVRPELEIYYHYDTSISVSSANIAKLNVLSIYPNPAINTVTVQYSSTSHLPVAYRVVNMQGQVIVSSSTISNKGLNKLDVNIAPLSTGMYMLYLNNGSEVVVRKFLKK